MTVVETSFSAGCKMDNQKTGKGKVYVEKNNIAEVEMHEREVADKDKLKVERPMRGHNSSYYWCNNGNSYMHYCLSLLQSLR